MELDGAQILHECVVALIAGLGVGGVSFLIRSWRR